MADLLFIAINTVVSLFNLSFIFVIVCGFLCEGFLSFVYIYIIAGDPDIPI
jgi:hypothetical protein